ncbi:MAG: hypothetical protein ACU0C9_05045 [Paracoccaceae bacterium]
MPKNTAQYSADNRADNANQNTQAQPGNQAAKNIAAKIIGAKYMLPGTATHEHWRLQLVEKIHHGVRIKLKRETENGDKKNKGDIDHSRRCQPLAGQPPPSATSAIPEKKAESATGLESSWAWRTRPLRRT